MFSKMKTTKFLLAGLLAVASAHLASAATTIRITGSTAFRAATYSAIDHILNSGYTSAFTGASVSSAGQAIFSGTTVTGNYPVVIKTSFSGSVGGIQSVTQQINTLVWLKDSVLPGSGSTANVSTSIPGNVETAIADVTMSDSIQNSTTYRSPALTKIKVGVVPFVWVRNNGAPSTISNITPLLARSLLSYGAPLSMFSNNASDASMMVFPIGRDQDSGTRLAAFAETGYGTLTPPGQYKVNLSGTTITSAELYPVNTVLGVTYDIGTSGYASGSNVKTALNATGSDTAPVYDTTSGAIGSGATLISSGAWYVGYLGTSDASGVTGVTVNDTTGWTGSALTYNGVPYSPTNVREGSYTFWTYEWLMYRNSGTNALTGTGKTVADQLANKILTVDAAVSGILVSTMHVSRAVEGGIITHN